MATEIAVCDLNCRIQFFDPVSTQQVGIIEAKADLGNFRREDDLVSGKTASKGRYVIVRTIFVFLNSFTLQLFFIPVFQSLHNAVLFGGRKRDFGRGENQIHLRLPHQGARAAAPVRRVQKLVLHRHDGKFFSFSL